MKLDRRGFLQLLGVGAAAVAVEPIIEPVRKLWFVGSNAPVGSRIERVDYSTSVMLSLEHGHTYFDEAILEAHRSLLDQVVKSINAGYWRLIP